MTTASDAFTRTENPLANGWTVQSGLTAMKCAATFATGSVDATDCGSVWVTDSFGGNQYSEGVITVQGECGLWVRGSTSVQQGYLFHGTASLFTLYKYNGTFNSLGTFGSGNLNAHTYRIEATGSGTTTIKCYDNGGLISTITDSSSPFTSGRPGIYSFSNALGWESWNGGDLAADSGHKSRMMMGVG